LLVLVVLALAACGQASGQPLATIHGDVEDFASAEARNDAYCYECHEPANVVAAARDYDGQPDVNIHEPPAADHPAMTCVSCHALETLPTLGCNQSGCHAYPLPPDWT
jgi:hypothetical protein